MDVISEKLVTDAKAKGILRKRKKEMDELKYVQKNTLGILKNSVKIKPKEAEELIAELQKIEKLRERHIISIINALPQDKDDLRTVLQKEYSSLSDEEASLILQTIKKIS
jgi:DNA-directed RNA polymerase subunit F